jgi:hypothetical protein
MKVKEKTRITAAEIKFTRTEKYTWMDNKINKDKKKRTKAVPLLDEILKYKSNWIQHVDRMQRDRLPKVLRNYKQH